MILFKEERVMCARHHFFSGFGFGFSPFGFHMHCPWHYPSRDEYLKMLEEYRDELKHELEEVEKEIAELKKKT
jgi:predicted metal-binding protein